MQLRVVGRCEDVDGLVQLQKITSDVSQKKQEGNGSTISDLVVIPLEIPPELSAGIRQYLRASKYLPFDFATYLKYLGRIDNFNEVCGFLADLYHCIETNHHTTVQEITSNNRDAKSTMNRRIVFFILHNRYDLSLNEIAALTASKDGQVKNHAAVLAGLKQFDTMGLDNAFYREGNVVSLYHDSLTRYKGVKPRT